MAIILARVKGTDLQNLENVLKSDSEKEEKDRAEYILSLSKKWQQSTFKHHVFPKLKDAIEMTSKFKIPD